MNARPFDQLALQRLVVDPGLEFHYVEGGVGASLVFVHGGSGDYGSWAPQWDAFTPHFRCISYSRRYNTPNRNAHPSPAHSAIVEAGDLRQLLAAWRAEPAVLVGSSYGGFTALALALREPAAVRALVLVEPPLLGLARDTTVGRASLQAFEDNVRRPARDAFLQGDDESATWLLGGGILGQQQLDDLPPEARARRLRNARAMRMLSLSSDEFPALDDQALGALTVPTLLMSGRCTPALHAVTFDALCRRMPRARVCRVADAGHSVAREQPSSFNRLALGFLTDLGLIASRLPATAGGALTATSNPPQETST